MKSITRENGVVDVPQLNTVPKRGFFCQFCRELCPSITALKCHIKCNHSPTGHAGSSTQYQEVKCSSCKVEYFMCLHCCCAFYTMKRIMEHIERHQAKICFRCAICSIECFISDRWHLFSHSVEPFCSVCQPNKTEPFKAVELRRFPAASSDADRRDRCVPPFNNTKKEFVLEERLKLQDRPAVSSDAESCLRSSQSSEKESRIKQELELQVPPTVSTDVKSCLSSSESTIEEQHKLQDHPAVISDTEGCSSQSDNSKKEFMIEDVTSWDPAIVLHSLPADILVVGGTTSICDPDTSTNVSSRGNVTCKPIRRCDFCGKTFPATKRMKYLSHIETRHGIEIDHPNKQFQCHICDKTFAYIQSLQLHVKGHYMKIIQCDFCQQRFRQRRNYRYHKCVESNRESCHTAST